MMTPRRVTLFLHAMLNASGLVTNNTITDVCFGTIANDYVSGIEIIKEQQGYYIFPALYAFYGMIYHAYDVVTVCPGIYPNIKTNVRDNVFNNWGDVLRIS